MTKKKVLVVCGTRPEIIKMAPVYHALRASATLEPVLLHTGQHTDLAVAAYQFFGLTPDHNMDLARKSNSLSDLSTALLEQVSSVIAKVQPSAVLVHGDTSSAAMAALAAFYAQVPIGHVEAGLRTGDKYSPFPEEMNRSLIGRMADWHFSPTALSTEALKAEGISTSKILQTGNTVIDAALLTANKVSSEYVDEFVAGNKLVERAEGKRLILVTAHRRENWGAGLESIAHSVCDIVETHPDTLVVWPLHANPAVAKSVRDTVCQRNLTESKQLILTQPLDYPTLVWLLHKSWAVLTDSGGIQEEAAAFGAPVLVLRDTTERPELIEAGGGVLTGASRQVITDLFNRLSASPELLAAMKGITNPFGDGTAAIQIVKHLSQVLS